MGCGLSIKVLPMAAQRAIKTKEEPGTLVLSMSAYDLNYEWYCETCRHLQYSSIKNFTINFDTKDVFPGIFPIIL